MSLKNQNSLVSGLTVEEKLKLGENTKTSSDVLVLLGTDTEKRVREKVGREPKERIH